MKKQKKSREEQQTNVTLKGVNNDRTWLGEPWVDSQMMSIKLTIPTEGNGWEEAQYSYWGIHRNIPTLWGIMGTGCLAYHEPTYFVEGQGDTETHKGLPILWTVFWEKLIHEQDVFNDIWAQTTEHSICHN